jgi:hypothetical protein
VELHGELRVELFDRDVPPRVPVCLEVALHDVLEIADAARIVRAIGAPFTHAGLVMIRPQRIDRLQHERDREKRVDGGDAAFDLPLEDREVFSQAALRCEDDERRIEAAHQDHREAGIAVAQVELVVALVERVIERAVELPGAKRTGAVQLLGLPLQSAAGVSIGSDLRGRGCGVHDFRYRPLPGWLEGL